MSSTPHRRKVWLDCDPGHDDAFAIILAGTNEAIELLGISTVAGNQTVENTTRNALRMCELSGINVDVVKGQAFPLMRPSRICPEIHGISGLDSNFKLPPPTKLPLAKKAVLHMADVILASPEPIILVATACLTNVALLLSLFPECKEHIEKIVLLGGAIGCGNITPSAEFNILVDPEAARMVFESGVDIVMVPIDVSHTVLVTPEVKQRIVQLGTTYSAFLGELLMFFSESYKTVFGFDFPPLHDPLAVAYVIDPGLFTTTKMRVDIETSSDLCAGETICDIYGMSHKPKNVLVARSVNVPKFWDLLLHSITLANSQSPLSSV
ncbi:N-D-ribosylpurine ribohydrolase [Pelomyxa schiedti]|nr:N-D-ribosylpurine ribohydrolase [Pelomyxa schiedti]